MTNDRPIAGSFAPKVGAPIDLAFKATASATDSGCGVVIQGTDNAVRIPLSLDQLLRLVALARSADSQYRWARVCAN